MVSEEEIKKRMLQQRMQEQMKGQIQEQMQQQQMEAALKLITSQILDRDARERLSNLKVVKPDVAMQLEMYLVQLYQTGQLRSRITDSQLISILRKLSEKKEINIRRK